MEDVKLQYIRDSLHLVIDLDNVSFFCSECKGWGINYDTEDAARHILNHFPHQYAIHLKLHPLIFKDRPERKVYDVRDLALELMTVWDNIPTNFTRMRAACLDGGECRKSKRKSVHTHECPRKGEFGELVYHIQDLML